MTVTLLDRSSEAEWLEQRRQYITATEVGKLANGGPAAWAVLKAEKLGAPSTFTGNRYTEWGKEREPYIMSNLEFLYDVHANDRLAVLDGTRWAGTPDAIGELRLGEGKTTTRDWELNPRALPQHYQDQMLWCQMVFDLRETAFGWELNDNFTPGQFRHLLFPRDDDRLAMLVDTAEAFLRYLEDEQAVGEWEDVTAAAYEVKRRLDAAQAEWDDLLDKIRDRAGDNDLAVKTAFGSISLAYPKPRAALDQAALKAAHPAIYEEFVKLTPPSKRTLRVTPKNEGTN